MAAALLLGAPRGWKVVAYGWTLAAVVFLVFDRLIGLTLPRGPVGVLTWTSSGLLLDGLRHGDLAGQPALGSGRLPLGTAVGVLPGIGPALTVAMLLPITSTVGPDSPR